MENARIANGILIGVCKVAVTEELASTVEQIVSVKELQLLRYSLLI